MSNIFEFQEKLERKPGNGRRLRNKLIKFPNGVVMSIQCSSDAACYPKQDFEDPKNYAQYEVALSYKGRWISFPAYHDFFHDGIGERVPAKKVQEMYDMVKRMSQSNIEKLPYVKKANIMERTSVDFGTPFSENELGRKLNQEELLRAVRFSIAAEYEAVQLYEQVAEASDDPQVSEVMGDVAREEVVHAGEFMALLKKIDPDESKAYSEGEEEVRNMLKGATENDPYISPTGMVGIKKQIGEIQAEISNQQIKVSDSLYDSNNYFESGMAFTLIRDLADKGRALSVILDRASGRLKCARVSLSDFLRKCAEEADKDGALAHSIYLKYMSSPKGSEVVEATLKKYPKYNLDRKEAQKATEEIMCDIKKRLKISDSNLDLDRLFESIKSKVLAGIT